MTSIWLSMFLVTMISVVSFFSVRFGYIVNGTLVTQTVPQAGGIMAAFDIIGDMIMFGARMMTFQVDDMPLFIMTLFLVMNLAVFVLIIRFIRGVE